MDMGKEIHAIVAAALSLLSAARAVFVSELSHVASAVAIAAGIYSLMAARATLKLRKKESEEIDNKHRINKD